jgi:hypothetical protein
MWFSDTPVISVSIIKGFVVICICVVFYIQCKAYWTYKYDRVYYRPINFSRIYNEARIESLQNRQRRWVEMGVRLNATQADPAFSFGSEKRRYIPGYTTERKYEPFTARRSTSYGADLDRRQLSFGNYNTTYEYRDYNAIERQGDETEAMNSLAFRLYEKLNISNKIITWANNIKHWMRSNYVPLVLMRHNQNLSQLNRILAPYGREVIFNQGDKLRNRNDSRSLLLEELCDSVILNKYDLSELLSMRNFSFAYTTEATLKDELKKVLQARIELERSFKIADFPSTQREYVIERLKRLQLNFSAEYNNNGGSELWNASLPKDSDVHFHTTVDNLLVVLYNDTAVFFGLRNPRLRY